jgi:hypothetical protein
MGVDRGIGNGWLRLSRLLTLSLSRLGSSIVDPTAMVEHRLGQFSTVD